MKKYEVSIKMIEVLFINLLYFDFVFNDTATTEIYTE